MEGGGREKVDADPVAEFATESSCWRTVLSDVDSVDNVYFFGTNGHDRDNSILSEFGWNLPPPPDQAEPGGSTHGEFDRIIVDSNLAGNGDDDDDNNNNNNTTTTSTTSFSATQNTCALASSSSAAAAAATSSSTVVAAVLADLEGEQQPMASSSSSEDVPEKSTASGGSADRQPSETA